MLADMGTAGSKRRGPRKTAKCVSAHSDVDGDPLYAIGSACFTKDIILPTDQPSRREQSKLLLVALMLLYATATRSTNANENGPNRLLKMTYSLWPQQTRTHARTLGRQPAARVIQQTLMKVVFAGCKTEGEEKWSFAK